MAGVTVIEASSSQIYDAAAGADVVLAETPTNPALEVVDLHRLATICRDRGARLLMDNTAATPLGQQPLSLGADAVVASATKALSGHSDLLAGYVATNEPELLVAVERQRVLAGAILGGFEAWLLLRSLASAGLRFERQCQNARAVATQRFSGDGSGGPNGCGRARPARCCGPTVRVRRFASCCCGTTTTRR